MIAKIRKAHMMPFSFDGSRYRSERRLSSILLYRRAIGHYASSLPVFGRILALGRVGVAPPGRPLPRATNPQEITHRIQTSLSHTFLFFSLETDNEADDSEAKRTEWEPPRIILMLYLATLRHTSFARKSLDPSYAVKTKRGILPLMSVPELELSLIRTRGRAPAPAIEAAFVRNLGEADLALMASGRGIKAPQITKLRDRHHALARVLAQGASEADASAITGYCPSRISILKADPTFAELVAHYQAVQSGAQAEFVERATLAALTAMNNLQEMLEDDATPLPASMQLEIAKTFADRVGHAPVQTIKQTNINVDLGGRLAAARSRLENARQEVVQVVSNVSEANDVAHPPVNLTGEGEADA